jgi:predicted nucleic acid-binding protein
LIVVDASAVAAALVVDAPIGAMASERLASDHDQRAPSLIDLEILSMLRRWLAQGRLGSSRADQAVVDLASLPIERYPHVALLPRVWELRHNLTPYDGAYVALAEALGAPLVTADGRLARATGPRCGIELLA